MQAIFFFVTALLAACALAAPMPQAQSLTPRSFSVSSKARNPAHRNPAKDLVKVYAKYGWEVIVYGPNGQPETTIGLSAASSTAAPQAATSTAANAAAASATSASSAPAVASAPAAASGTTGGETGQVTASPEANDSEYLETVTIGGQSIALDFDTGSSDLWVFSDSLPSSETAGHTLYSPSKSNTFQALSGASFMISYGDGSSASGTVGYDVVNIGGATATKQAVEIATAVSGSFVSDTKNDGLVGLAFSKLNTVKPTSQLTFFDNVKSQLAAPVFTANLQVGATGTYTFGKIDPAQYTGQISYTPVNSASGFWEFTSDSYAIGGTTHQCTTCSPAIADTGTSLILVDPDVATAYWSQVQGATNNAQQGGFTYPCSASLPTLGLAIGNFTANVNGSDLQYASLGGGQCFGGLQSNQGQGIQIFGDVFLKNYLAVFDGGNVQFGIAQKA